MKKASKNVKLITTLALLVLAFLCSFNLVSAYFTATANADGEMAFPDLDVRFLYRDKASNNQPAGTEEIDDAVYTINLYPVGGTISRGQEFKLSATAFEEGKTQEEISQLIIKNMSNSADAYVRFWIDAYIVTGNTINTSVNYGKYFFLDEEGFYTRGDDIDGIENDLAKSCYYCNEVLNQEDNEVWIGDSLTLKDISDTDPVPNALLGSQLKLTISLQAVQAANQAFSSVFNDARGYYPDWE